MNTLQKLVIYFFQNLVIFSQNKVFLFFFEIKKSEEQTPDQIDRVH